MGGVLQNRELVTQIAVQFAQQVIELFSGRVKALEKNGYHYCCIVITSTIWLFAKFKDYSGLRCQTPH